MRAHPSPSLPPRPLEDFLIDEEFDIMDMPPAYNRTPPVRRLVLVCGHEDWDDFEVEH